MRKIHICFIALLLILSMNATAFATATDSSIEDIPILRYSTVNSIKSNLSKSESSASCSLRLKANTGITAVHGTFKLIDLSGNVVSTDSRYLKEAGSYYSYTHNFNMPKKGTYKVKYTLKTYKDRTLKETICLTTNSVSK